MKGASCRWRVTSIEQWGSSLLTPRQQQVLDALKQGMSEKQTAGLLGVSPHTIHVHVKAIYRQYRVSSRGELLAHLLRQVNVLSGEAERTTVDQQMG